MMNIFLEKVNTIVNNNEKLKNSIVLKSVLENIKYTGDNLSYLSSLKEGICDVNKYLNDKDLTSIITSIDEKIENINKTDISGFIMRKSNEFDIVSIAESIKSSPEVSNPRLTGYLTQLINEYRSNNHPTYLYINSLLQNLSGYTEYICVRESIELCKQYINENQEMLVILDTIHYIDSMGSRGLNPKTSTVLKESLFESQYNPDIIEMRLGDSSKFGTVSTMLESLRSIRRDKNPMFDLGSGKGDTRVYDYIGPVLKEDKDVTFFVNGSYIHISPNTLDESAINKTIESKDSVKVYEMSDVHIYNTNNDFYNTTKAFESMGFGFTNNGISCQLSKSNVHFKVNEHNNIELYINSKLVSDVNSAKKNDMFIFESQSTKSTLFYLLEKSDLIYNMPFVKFLVNEKLGSSSMIMNILDGYYVYDFVSEKQTDVYKLDGYKLYEYCLGKFGYDVSHLFKIDINNTNSEFNKIQEEKNQILDMINQLNESLSKIDKTLGTDIQKHDIKVLSELRESVLSEIDNIKESYNNLCIAQDLLTISKSDAINESDDYKSDIEDDKKSEGDEEDTEETQQDTEETQEEAQVDVVNESHRKEGDVVKYKCDDNTSKTGKIVSVKGESGYDILPDGETEPVFIEDKLVESADYDTDSGESSEFKAHGYYTVSNAGGYEIMISDCGESAKIKDGEEVTDWLTIEFVGDSPVIDPTGYNISLDLVMRINEETPVEETPVEESIFDQVADSETEFVPMGEYNDLQIMLSSNGMSVKIKDGEEVTDWLQIQMIPNIETGKGEMVIDPTGYNIPLNLVKRKMGTEIKESILINEDDSKFKIAKVTYDTGDVISTQVNPILSDDQIKDYFAVGKQFNLGSGENDLMATVTSCEIMDDSTGDDNSENKQDGVIDFVIPDWAVSFLINGDSDGMTDEEIHKVNMFVDKTVQTFGNANFILSDESLGFCKTNDIDDIESNCVMLSLNTVDNINEDLSSDKKYYAIFNILGEYNGISYNNGVPLYSITSTKEEMLNLLNNFIEKNINLEFEYYSMEDFNEDARMYQGEKLPTYISDDWAIVTDDEKSFKHHLNNIKSQISEPKLYKDYKLDVHEADDQDQESDAQETVI